jgi:uncharacterized protein YciI
MGPAAVRVIRRATDVPADVHLMIVEPERHLEAFAQADPYVREGLVRRWEVQPWAVVVGGAP